MKPLDRFIRFKELLFITGMSRTQIKMEIKRGTFPRGRPLSDTGRSVAWPQSEVVAWQQKRMAMTKAIPAKVPEKNVTSAKPKAIKKVRV